MGRTSKGRATSHAAPVIILVRPQLGENIGMAARAMLNCGLSSLRLVNPRDGWPNPKAQRAASGADVVLEKAKVFDSVADAVADLERVVATSARNRELSQRILSARHAALEMRGWTGQGDKVGILFGPERTGLENDETQFQELFRFQQTGIDAEGNATGFHSATGNHSIHMDHFAERGESVLLSVFNPAAASAPGRS